MRVKVLGCSGAIAKDCRTTSFLLDDDVLIDAGTGVGDLSLDEMRLIDDVFLTHSHLDHVLALPLMLDSVGVSRKRPLRVHALASTLTALKNHIFNNVIWPDFSTIPSPDAPCITFHEIHIGHIYEAGSKSIEVLSAVHAVPAVGFAVAGARVRNETVKHWVFSGDTGCNPAFWRRVNQLQVGMLVIEATFGNSEKALAARSLHLSADALMQELQHIEQKNSYPVYITHAKPAEMNAIMREIELLNHASADVASEMRQPASSTASVASVGVPEARLHRIAWLSCGQVFEV